MSKEKIEQLRKDLEFKLKLAKKYMSDADKSDVDEHVKMSNQVRRCEKLLNKLAQYEQLTRELFDNE